MDPTLDERLEKIRNSPKLQSQQQTHLVLSAVEDTLRDQKTDFTPTAYFAALLALLGQYITSSKGVVNKDVASAIVYLLDLVTPHVPAPLLRSKFSQILQKLAIVLTYPHAEAPLLRPSIGCLASLLLVQDSQAWAQSPAQISPRRAVAGLLTIAVDHRPKVRKRAHDAIAKVLKNPPPSPSLDHPAADMCAETALQSLKDGVELYKQEKKQHKDPHPHTPNLIHTLQLIKVIADASGGWPSRKTDNLCEALLDISRSSNEYLTMASFEVFEVIFEGMSEEVSSTKLPHLLEILEGLQPSENDTQLMPPWIAVLSRGYDVSAQVKPDDTFQKIHLVFDKVSRFMSSVSYNIRASAADCLISFLVNCVPASALTEPEHSTDEILKRLSKSASDLLNVKYQSAWMDSFRVFGVMFDTFLWRSAPLLSEIVRTVGQLRSSESFNGKKEADAVLSKAIRAMGPEGFLKILPLNLAIKTSEPGRVWLLPLLRDAVSNTRLGHFKSDLVPLSQKMYQKIVDHGDAEKTVEIKIYETIVSQIWATLHGYCDLPMDLSKEFDQNFAELISNVLYQQVDLRSDVCRALQRLVESNKDRVALTVETEVLLRVSKDEAEQNLQHLATFAGNLLSILFNIYMETLPQYRGPVLQCINAYLSITAEQDLVETFGRVAATLESSLAETNSHTNGKGSAPKQIMPPLTHTLMDLVITIAVYLPRSSLSQLFNIAIIVLNKDDPTLQKKAYKIIPRLAKSEVGKVALQERCEELQELLLGCADKALPPARRDRLASIGQLIPILPSSKLQFIPSVLPEVVICTKESNEKAKTNAFDLLIAMGDKMKEGGTIQNSKVPHMPPDAEDVSASLEEYLTMVSAGLAGTTPHSISASIIAITRIMYHFRESLSTATIAHLVETMDIFLKSPNREVVRSVLGFVKISIISLPVDIMQPRLVTLIPNLLNWSHEHKGRIQAKVKHIFERMMRRFGIQLVEKLTPEKDRKLITNIRKTRERRKKKKHATDDQKTDGGDEPEASSQKKTFESGLDEAIYGSDEDSATGSDVSDDEILVGRPPRRAKKGGETYIVEDDDEPLDLLDKRALAHISTTKPLRKTEKQNKKRKATVDLDGKLILGQNPDTDMADVETGDGDLESGINAYVQAIKNIKGPRKAQRGNMKLGNSTRQHTANEDMDVDGNDGEGVKSKERNRPASRSPGRGGIKAPRGRGRGMGVEKTRGGRVTKGSSKIGRH